MSKETGNQAVFERSAAIFMAFVCAISILAITGWLFNQPILASLRPEYVPMAPVTALIFLGLCGTWLIHRVFPTRRGMMNLVQASLLGILIIVLIVAFRTFTGVGPDLEELLYPNPSLFGQFLTAHMSPQSALGFCLAILAFLLITGSKPGQRIKNGTAALSLALFFLSGLIILGYLFEAPLFYGGTLIPVAITTAISFWFLSLGLLMMAGPACWPVRVFVGTSLKARLLRAFIPASIVIALLQGLLSRIVDKWIEISGLLEACVLIVSLLIFMLTISLLSNKLSADIERSEQARLQAESTLKQSEARFRTLVETANDAIINIDQDGHIVFWNRAAERIFGFTEIEVNGKGLEMIIPEGFRAAHQQGLQRVVLTGETHIIGKSVDVRGLRKDGREFPLVLSVATWKVGKDVFFTGIARDISERKKAEEALQKSENQFHKLFEQAAVGVALLDTKTGHYLGINQKYCDFLGYTKEEMLNLSLQVVTLPDDIQENIDYNAKLLNGEIREFTIEKRYIRKDGRIVWGELTASPLWVPGEETSEYMHIAVVQDISDRKQNELIQNVIYRITQTAISSDGTDALYHSIHSILGELIPAENFFIALYDSATGFISFPYFIDQYNDPLPASTQMQGLTGYVIRSGRSLIATREMYDRLVQQGEVKAAGTVGTVGEEFLRVPLKIAGRIIGVIGLQSYLKGIHFKQEDVELLEFVSTQVAQAIERKRLEEEIRSLSLTDELTGLYNRRGFTLLAEQEVKVAHRIKRSMLLFFADVDNLKVINDFQGHAQGDLALKEVSTILKETFREADIPARIGGDEFLVLALDASIESEDMLVNRIQANLERHNQVGDVPYQLSLSMGVARCDPEAAFTISELISQADGRMYQQKQAKKGKK